MHYPKYLHLNQKQLHAEYRRVMNQPSQEKNLELSEPTYFDKESIL
jgi:hypothetical protein